MSDLVNPNPRSLHAAWPPPLLLAAIGELVVEKSGVINLGVEGMMLIGGLAGLIGLYQLQSSDLHHADRWRRLFCTAENSVNQFQYIGSLVVAALVGAMAAALFGFLTQYFRANHIAAGLGPDGTGGGALELAEAATSFGVDYTRRPSSPACRPCSQKAGARSRLWGRLLFSQNLLGAVLVL